MCNDKSERSESELAGIKELMQITLDVMQSKVRSKELMEDLDKNLPTSVEECEAMQPKLMELLEIMLNGDKKAKRAKELLEKLKPGGCDESILMTPAGITRIGAAK